MAPIWKAPRDANCNSKISIFKYTLQLIPGEKHFPPLMGMVSVVLRKKVESVLLNERKFAARSSSPWSLRGLPSFCVSCCGAFPWAQVRVEDNWNRGGKRHRLMAAMFITSSAGASVKVIIYTCRCLRGPGLSEDQVHAVSLWQTGFLYWHLGLLGFRQISSWLGRANPKFQHPVWIWELGRTDSFALSNCLQQLEQGDGGLSKGISAMDLNSGTEMRGKGMTWDVLFLGALTW